ncbi:MAG: hypothetical protein PVSMB9_03120 [Candidatus Dormibacteria bacterium]
MRIVLAVADTAARQAALDRVSELAQVIGITVVVLHVRERHHSRGVVWDEGSPADAAELLNESVHDLQRRNVAASGLVRLAVAGRVAEAIVAAAVELEADLIVLGRSSESTLGRFLGTSLSQRAVSLAPMPVLVVPAAGVLVSRRVSSAS